ncbi:MAG: outer membrane protein assembly factor BamE [Casimicrobiaceae bacterium]|nr:outer membrane protein assembly factor BamE [Casimicrobiaceae bacterium]
MHRLFRFTAATLASAALALLAACDRVATGELQPGFSTVTDLRAKMGEPRVIYREQGREIWVYPLGPEGVKTYFMSVSPDGKLTAIDQVLTEANFARIQPGMTRQEVEAIIGPPGREARYAMTPNEVTHKWRFLRGNEAIFFDVTYTLPDGRVKATGYDEVTGRPDAAR